MVEQGGEGGQGGGLITAAGRREGTEEKED